MITTTVVSASRAGLTSTVTTSTVNETVHIADVGTVTGAAPLILDGTSPTGAWSMFRDLLTSFGSGTRYTTATGVDSLKDQTGHSLHLNQATTTAQPAVSTAGPNSRTCADFDGTDDSLGSVLNLINNISDTAGYMVVSFIADAVTLNSGTFYANNPIIAAVNAVMGVFLRDTGTPDTIYSYHFDGNQDHADIASAITTGTAYVAEWRHEGGNIYIRLNGGTEVSAASGNSTSLTTGWHLGYSQTGGTYGNIKVFELATWSTVPALATRDAIVADFMRQTGAGTNAYSTQTAVEEWTLSNPDAQSTQTAVEMWAPVTKFTTWSPTDKTANVTLTGSNLIATSGAGGLQQVRTADRQIAGKFYWEAICNTIVNSLTGVGVHSSGYSFSNGGFTAGGAALGTCGVVQSGGTIYRDGASTGTALGALAAGNVVGIAIDCDARLIWFRIGAGNWNGNVANNPATGIGGISIAANLGVGIAVNPSAVLGVTSDQVTANFGDTAFTGAVPSGYTAGWPQSAIDTNALATQFAAESWFTTTAPAQVTQMAAEVWINANIDTQAQITQAALEQWFAANPDAQITQAALEMWASVAFAYDPYFDNVVLLVGADGTDGSNVFTDLSRYHHTLTSFGNAQIDTGQAKFGGASAQFYGSSDYISAPDHAAFDLSDANSDQFTIEAWVRYASDPYWANVVLLVGAEGADASTTFVDESISAKALTPVGNAQIDTAQFKFGTSSMLLDGTGDYVAAADSPDWTFSTGPFTIECFARFSAHDGTVCLVSQWGSTTSWAFWFDAGLIFFRGVDTAGALKDGFSTGFAPTLNQWYHLAVDRDASGNLRVYRDGVMLSKNTGYTHDLRDGNGPLNIGTVQGFPAYDLAGWLDEVRITKGVARYASDSGYTVPTAAFPRS